jgi:flagellar motor switch protein FliN/FliY
VDPRAPDQFCTDAEMSDENTPSPEQPEPVEPQADASAESAEQTAPTPEASDEDAAALEAAKSTVDQVQDIADSAAPSAEGESFNEPAFESGPFEPGKGGLDLLSDVNLNVRIELGRTKMFVEDVLKLNDGAVVELDKLAGDPVDVFVNDRHVARGEVLVLNDNFCVRINEIVALVED